MYKRIMSFMSSEREIGLVNDRPLRPTIENGATFNDIAAIWKTLDDVENPLSGEDSRLPHIRQESENVHISFYKYMHMFSSMFRDKEQPFIPKAEKNVGEEVRSEPEFYGYTYDATVNQRDSQVQRQVDIFRYNTDALLQVLRSQKVLADRITAIDIREVLHEIKRQREKGKNEKAKTEIHNKLSRAFFKCTICLGTIIITSKHLKPIICKVPKTLIAGFCGGTAVLMGFSDYTYWNSLNGLSQRVNTLNGLSKNLYQLQERANAFRNMISDLIIDIQYMKIMEKEGTEVNEDETERLTCKLNRLKHEAKTNEFSIKRSILRENPFIIFEE
ncbi:unnamed protein product [Mucor hiemalis]